MKRIGLLIVTVAAALFANAQFNFGVHTSLSLNTVTSPKERHVLSSANISSTSFTPGASAGLVGRYEFTRNLAVVGELNYSLRGYKDRLVTIGLGPDNKEIGYKIRSSYIDIPVMLQIFPSSRSGVNISVGPMVSYLVSRSAKFDDKNADVTLSALFNENNKIDYGVLFGVGYIYQNCSIDLRYYMGLADGYKDISGYRNQGIQLSIAYYLK